MGLDLVSVIVREYDEAIDFFVDVLGCVVEDDSPSLDGDGQPKKMGRRASAGLRLCHPARSGRGEEQEALIGRQFAGRVGLFLRVEDFYASYTHMMERGVEFLTVPRTESYGQVAVFKDLYGNKWDLLGAA